MMDTIQLGNLAVSRLILGGNPFSGFSHQSPQIDMEMKKYFTTARIKETFQKAESLGIITHIGRADHHIMRILLEYWEEGGKIQWIAQTCPEVGSLERGIQNAINGGAKACFLHGGEMDYRFANHQLKEVPDAIQRIKDAGLAAGVAGHKPEVHQWAEENLDVDFHMCSYYNPTMRETHKEHISELEEHFEPSDRDRMIQLIQTLSTPVIHYKVFAAGRNNPEEVFALASKSLRSQDALCFGVYPKVTPDIFEQNMALYQQYCAFHKKIEQVI